MAVSASDPEELGKLIDLAKSKGWLSLRQAAPFFGVHYLTVRNWAINGKLRTFEVGNRKVVTLEEIERFRMQGNFKPEAEMAPEPIPKMTPGIMDLAAYQAPAQPASNGAGGGNTPPVAALGNYNPEAKNNDED